MPDLREQLQQLFQGRVCLMGLGNVTYEDDGFGVRLAEALISSAPAVGNRCRVIIAGTTPEWLIGRVVGEHSDHVVFLDAVEFGGLPGSAVLLDSDEMAARFPQISTHKLSLGLLAKQVEANGRTKAWLLGVQPESLRLREELTPTVRATLELLLDLLKAGLSSSSRGNEAPTSRGRWLDERESLSLVTSAATYNSEVRA
jgi:hydrogenase maturation protease